MNISMYETPENYYYTTMRDPTYLTMCTNNLEDK